MDSKDENNSDESQSQRENNDDQQNQRGKNKKSNNDPKKDRRNSNSDEENGKDESTNTNRKGSKKHDSNNSGPRERRSLGKRFGNRRNTGFNDNFNDNNDNNDSSSGNQRNKNSFKPKINKRKNTPWQMSSEEPSENQSSGELQLEDQWKISGKEEKNAPPHQPFHLFSLAHRSSYDLSCLNPKLRQVIADIASDLQDTNIMPEKHTPAKLSLAVDICRSLPLDQLQSVSEEVFEVHTGAVAANNQR